MPTPLTYTTYQTQIVQMAAIDSVANVNFQEILPQMINYAELRICRDLDFLFASEANSSYSFTAGNRSLTIPEGTFVTTEQINVIMPAGTTDPNAGTRVALLPTTKEFLDAVYGDSSVRGVPKYYAPFNDNLFLVGPFPDNTYRAEIVGMTRPETMSATNPTTFIGNYLPDLFIMASMIYISAFQRNFGRQADDPQMAQSYENQYKVLLQGASVEEARKKYEGPAWSSQSPTPVATPSR